MKTTTYTVKITDSFGRVFDPEIIQKVLYNSPELSESLVWVRKEN